MKSTRLPFLMALAGAVAASAIAPAHAAQPARIAQSAMPPVSCHVRPRGLPDGDYAWDAPACAKSRDAWLADHSPAVAATANEQWASLSGGTPLTVHLNADITSNSAQADQTFTFTVDNDVRNGDWVIIAAGAQGVGTVAAVEANGSNGHAGMLNLHFDYVYAVDGSRIRVDDSDHISLGAEKKGAASTATIVSYVLIGVPGLFVHNWVHGHDASIPANTDFQLFVADTVRVRPGVRN